MLERPLGELNLRGFGPKRALALESEGVLTVRDALLLLPRRYEDLRRPLDPVELLPERVGRRSLVRGVVGPVSRVQGPKGGFRFPLFSLRSSTGRGQAAVFFFGFKYPPVREGEEALFFGKVREFNGNPCLANPRVVPLTSDLLGRIVPVYGSSKALPSWFLRDLICQLLELLTQCPPLDPIPPHVRSRRSLVDLLSALRQIHWPSSEAAWRAARRRLSYHELFFLQTAFAARRAARSGFACLAMPVGDDPVGDYVRRLPFDPTPSQLKCFDEILSSFRSGPFDLLLQGDVGSGKTAVALFAASLCLGAGRSALFLSPTDILARQTFNFARLILGDHRVHLVTSSARTLGRDVTKAGPSLVVGTTALLHLGCLEDLRHALVIVDEQQRFGVAQRAALGRDHVSLLMVSATPIPRTMALGMYGDLRVITLDQSPSGRGRVRTVALPISHLTSVLRAVEEDLRSGGRAFWVCPTVSQGPSSAEGRFKWLKREIPWASPALVHGRMSPGEKEAAVERFRSGSSRVLVGTTVLEVGIDVPDATVMVVEGADLMGLSQLHQLRGRVGRGARDGLCVLMSSSREVPRRVKALEEVGSGFKVAELDLMERGPGTFHDTAQHGDLGLRVADLRKDLELIGMAREDAEACVRLGLSGGHEWFDGMMMEVEACFPGLKGLLGGG